MALSIGTSTLDASMAIVNGVTFAHDATGADMLVLGGGVRSTISSATYNAVSMTLLTAASNGAAIAQQAYLANPSSGSNNVVVVFTTASTRSTAMVTNFSGSNGTVGTVATNTGSSATPITGGNVTSGTGTIIIDFSVHGNSGGTFSPASPQTQIVNSALADQVLSSYQSGSTSTLHNDWTQTGGVSSVWATSAVAVNPSATAANGNFLAFM